MSSAAERRPRTTRTRVAARLLAAACAAGTAVGGAASLTAHVTDPSSAPIADAVVYAVPATPSTKPPLPSEVGQVSKTFTPLVTVVQTGAMVSFPNRDTVKHSIYSFSPAKIFQLKLYAGLPEAPVQFDKPGLVVLGCNIHDAMVAYILVVDTPHFGKTDANGTVRIDGLPAGEYQWAAWHPRIATVVASKPLRVANADLKVDTVVELKP